MARDNVNISVDGVDVLQRVLAEAGSRVMEIMEAEVARAIWTGEPGERARRAGVGGAGAGGGAAAPVGDRPGGGPAPLRGIILREESDTLVVQASPEEVATFGTGQAVSVAPVPREREEFFGRDAAAAPFAVPGEVLYTADGRAAAVVRSVNVWHDTHDVSAFGSPHASYVRGARHVGMEVDALMFDDRRRR